MNDTVSQTTSDQNEHILAALSHATALIPMMGVIAPIVIWTTQKAKSEFVAFQALQAIIYQFLMIIAYFAGMLCYALSIPIMMLIMGLIKNDPSEWVVIIPMFVIFAIFICGGFLMLYGLFAAIMTFLGKKFRYILIGAWLEKYLIKDLQPS